MANVDVMNAEISINNTSLELVDVAVAVIFSVIYLKLFRLRDGILHITIKDKIEAKSYEVKHIDNHRSSAGAFVRGDAMIEIVKAEIVKDTDFLLGNWKVRPSLFQIWITTILPSRDCP